MSGAPSRRELLAAGLSLTATGVGAAPRLAPSVLPIGEVGTIARGLTTPEGIATRADGSLVISAGGSSCTVVDAAGHVTPYGPPVPGNGVALDRRGRVLIACFGLLGGTDGPLLRLDMRAGTTDVLAAEVDGRRLVASNMPAVARDGSIYCTHSRWSDPTNIGATLADGFVYRVVPDGRATMVAGGLAGANGLCFDAGERHLYVALTAAGRIVRMRRRADGTLGEAEPFGPLLGEVVPDQRAAAIRAMTREARARLGYPDGLAFDADGNLWVTLPFANRILALTPGGERVDILHDRAGAVIEGPTNIAWGGRDRRTLHIACRTGGTVARVRTPVAGLALPGWR